jgi:hypothetical protein
MNTLKNWFSANVDSKTAISTVVGLSVFGGITYALKEFGGKKGKQVAEIAQGDK